MTIKPDTQLNGRNHKERQLEKSLSIVETHNEQVKAPSALKITTNCQFEASKHDDRASNCCSLGRW